ncbi:MAG: hypothetical protein WDO12_12580 [Pseudomonadota bacterium]
MIGPFFPDLQLVPETLSIFTDRIEIHIDRTLLRPRRHRHDAGGVHQLALVPAPRIPFSARTAAAAGRRAADVRVERSTVGLCSSQLPHRDMSASPTAGFHSQAGWIFFIGASFLVALLSRRIGWLRSEVASGEPAEPTDDNAEATAACLLPLVGILATGMLTRAASAGFDPLQWLRIPVALALLLFYRKSYAQLDWRCSWRGIAAGVIVFGAWLLAAHWLSAPTGMPAALAELPPAATRLVDRDARAHRHARRAGRRRAGIPWLPAAPPARRAVRRAAYAGRRIACIADLFGAVRSLAWQLLAAWNIRGRSLRRGSHAHGSHRRSRCRTRDGERAVDIMVLLFGQWQHW